MRRKGPDMEYIFTDKIRRRLTLMSPLFTEAMEKRARAILKIVICETVGKSVFEDKVAKTCNLLKYLITKLVNGPI